MVGRTSESIEIATRNHFEFNYYRIAAQLFDDPNRGESFFEYFLPEQRAQIASGSTRTQVTLDPGRIDWLDSVDNEGTDGLTPVTSDTAPRHFLVYSESVFTEMDRRLGRAIRFVETTELERRTQELARANEQLDQFASTVSHDLRNPLNVATGYLQMAMESVDPNEDATFDRAAAVTYLEKIDVSLERMVTIIDDILALVNNADPVTETDRVSFEDVARAAWETVDTRSATLAIEATGHVDADETRLQRMLENLFRNAIDHVGEDVAITTGLTDDGFFVADDGPGIPPEQREKIFEHGFTTGEDGTGLGLSIVAQLADAHGWSVSLDPGHDGAKFVVSDCEVNRHSEL